MLQPTRPSALEGLTRSCKGPFIALGLLLVCALLASCAPKTPPAPIAEEGAAAPHPDAVWALFLKDAPAAADAEGFSASASLNYAGPQAKSRVSVSFWGNLNYPLRLDLRAGLGSTVALWREDMGEFMAYLPDKQTAYVHQDGRLGMAAFGINLPFTLRELALLICGRFAELMPEHYLTVRRTNEGLYLFTVATGGRRFSVELTAAGVPVGMRTHESDPWSMEFSGSLEDQGLPSLPQKIRMQRSSGERAIVFIKELELKNEPWPVDALTLELPPETRVLLLKNTADG